MKAGKRFGAGRTSAVFKFDAGRVVKLFVSTVPRQEVDADFRSGQIAGEHDFPAPALVERVDIGGRQGIASCP